MKPFCRHEEGQVDGFLSTKTNNLPESNVAAIQPIGTR